MDYGNSNTYARVQYGMYIYICQIATSSMRYIVFHYVSHETSKLDELIVNF